MVKHAFMKKIFLLFVLLAWSRVLPQGGLSLEWSNPFVYDNKKDGFFDQYAGSNTQYVYAKFSNLAYKQKNRNRKIKLIAFHREDMSRAGEVMVSDNSPARKDLDYYKTLVLDNVLYVVWIKLHKGQLELYAESFDNTLRRVNPLKKVYELTVSRKGTDNLVLLYNQETGNKILLGKEFSVKGEQQQIRFEYKLLNEDFTVENSRQVTLPITPLRKPSHDNSFTNLQCSYELADDGNIYVESSIKIPDEERKDLKKRESTVYRLFMQVNPETGDVKQQSLKFHGKNTFNVSSVISKTSVKLYGFFCDLDKDPKGTDSHGLFYVSFDSRTFSPLAKKFSYFDKQFLDELYASDRENRKKGRGPFQKKESKISDQESIDDNYVIEQVIDEGTDITLFCSIMYNWSTSNCTTSSTGMTSCTYRYYCTKNNITAFRLNSEGDIVWARNLDRSVTYDGWNIYDVSVIRGQKDYYVLYGSAYQINAKVKNRRSSKSKAQNIDRFEYATFSQETGAYAKAEYQVNRMGVPSKRKKYISETRINVMHNKMYTECRQTRYKGSTWFGLLFPPSLLVLMNLPGMREGLGYLGVISTTK
jgi:hypothetical protein